MAATTPIYALPYPVPADPADVPADIKALADRLEVVLPTVSVFSKLFDTTLGAAGPSFDFSSIPQTNSHLLLVVQGRGDAAAVAIGVTGRLNGDAGANYNEQRVVGNAATVSATEGIAVSAATLGLLPGASAAAGMFGSLFSFIPNYRSTTGSKQMLGLLAYIQSLATANTIVGMAQGHWRTAGVAVNRLTVLAGSGNFIAGSRATLYGLG